MTEEGQSESPGASWRRRLARPIALLGLIGGAVFFLPRLARHDVRIVPRPDDPRCVRYARVTLGQSGEVLRSFKLLANAEKGFAGHEVSMAEGSYTATMVLECEDGDVTEQELQPIEVNGAGTVYLRIENRCRCDPG